ncbi:ATP-dependent nuclease [Aequorivita viscosa]|uniref:Predicted ATP-dependent endonuclease of the OLD family, contains P-loop ATPase and TOPRIM domains n=1 Tax=Aequorivita viscosa TaxID=797419 RepID=A0A1M6M4H1_9FLAO|nr:AAA family ATPase [Aequorivita viscosa]SDX30567.1 Predicted ATP-dependent endonuclease of the OLD family, contains P-loop ATPase and TOPRIM domains [Aequorivita viscosa]SHJ78307.1 Predicted ATP-dependent endonuclease of the OLD family, contains P-loop ATPase and TOPRIM domains [Aequorivita viscosa]
MILERILIEDFKSIKRLNLNLHSLTCLVGKNESGKSAILEAVSFLNFSKNKLTSAHTNKNSNRYDKDDFPAITGYFLVNDEEQTQVNNILPLSFDTNNKAIPKKNFAIKWIRIKINGNKEINTALDLIAGNNRTYNLKENYSDEDMKNIKNKIWEEVIPHIELITSENLVISPTSLEELQQNQGSFETFKRLFAIGGVNDLKLLKTNNIEKLEDKLYTISQKITDLLQENYSQDNSIRIDLKYSGDKFLLRIVDSSNRSYSLRERSVGFQYFFSFLINNTYLNAFQIKKNIFLLDEPGVSLHPEGARDLIKIFEDFALNEQVIYSTHNPFLAYRKKPDNLILVRRDTTKGTEIITKVYQNKYQILRKELGLLLNDSFLINDINIVVEGNSDKYLLHYIIHEEEEFEPLSWTNIFSADTVTEIIPSVRYLNSLDLKGLVLMDSDHAAKKEIVKPKFKTNISDNPNWDYFTVIQRLKDDSVRTMEDMLNQEAYITAYNTYYTEQQDTLEWKKKFSPIEIKEYPLPILDTLNPHFKVHLSGGINKIAVFRKFSELYPYDSNIGYYHDLMELVFEIKSKLIEFK